MKSKKILIIVLIIVIVLLLALGGVAFAYFTTDIFKTEEQLFYKYIGKTLESTQSLKSENLENYFEKLQTMPYENNGKLSVNVTVPEELGIDLDKVNNLNITFSGKTDKINDTQEQKIQLNYTDDISFPVEYRKVGNMIGITSDVLINKYLSLDLDRLEEFLANLGVTGIDAEEILTLTETNINEEQIKAELEKYKQVLLNNINETNFSKIDENNFALTLNEQEFLTLTLEMLKELKTSNLISEENKEQIDELLQDADISNATTETFIQIVVNKQGTVKIVMPEAPEITLQTVQNGLNIMISNEEVRLVIEVNKTEDSNGVTYHFGGTITDSGEIDNPTTVTIDLYATYSNLETQNVTEKYNLNLAESTALEENQETISYNYTLDTTNTFVNSVEVEDLNSNAVILNDADTEYLQGIIAVIAGQFEKVYTNQMQRLGVANEDNPLIYATPLGLFVRLKVNTALNNANQRMTEEKKEAFNIVYTSYQGPQNGTYTRALISRIQSNNASNPDKIITVNGSSNDAELTNLSNQVELAKTYTIVCNINPDTGIVDAINIYQ